MLGYNKRSKSLSEDHELLYYNIILLKLYKNIYYYLNLIKMF